jgi:hypothetical protein
MTTGGPLYQCGAERFNAKSAYPTLNTPQLDPASLESSLGDLPG